MRQRDKIKQAEYARKHYEANKEKMKERAVAHTQSVRRQIREELAQLKEATPCMDCKQFFPACVMDFDHRPEEEKLFTISQFAVKNYGIQKVFEEIDKCDIVCANCHRIRTYITRPMPS